MRSTHSRQARIKRLPHAYRNRSPKNSLTNLKWLWHEVVNREYDTGRFRKRQMRTLIGKDNLIPFWSSFSHCYWLSEYLVNDVRILRWKREFTSTLQRGQIYEELWWIWPYPPQRGQVCWWVWWIDGDNVCWITSIPVPWQRGQRTEVALRAIAEQTGHSISRDQARFDSYEGSYWKIEVWNDTLKPDPLLQWRFDQVCLCGRPSVLLHDPTEARRKQQETWSCNEQEREG